MVRLDARTTASEPHLDVWPFHGDDVWSAVESVGGDLAVGDQQRPLGRRLQGPLGEEGGDVVTGHVGLPQSRHDRVDVPGSLGDVTLGDLEGMLDLLGKLRLDRHLT